MKNQGPLKGLHELWPWLMPWQRKWLRLQGEAAYYFMLGIDWLYYRELYIFPPLAFIADYIWMKTIFPDHPMTQFAILATAFMSATLTLFILRPPKRKRIHWIS